MNNIFSVHLRNILGSLLWFWRDYIHFSTEQIPVRFKTLLVFFKSRFLDFTLSND